MLKKIFVCGLVMVAALLTEAGVWFKGEAAIKETGVSLDSHRFYIRWIANARAKEHLLMVQMTVRPDSRLFQNNNELRQFYSDNDRIPLQLMFNMVDSFGETIGELTFTVPPRSWYWNRDRIRGWFKRGDWSYWYSDLADDRKVVMCYFHEFFNCDPNCVTLFLKDVRANGESAYYDLGTTGPKIPFTKLKTSINKRSIKSTIDVKLDDVKLQASIEKNKGNSRSGRKGLTAKRRGAEKEDKEAETAEENEGKQVLSVNTRMSPSFFKMNQSKERVRFHCSVRLNSSPYVPREIRPNRSNYLFADVYAYGDADGNRVSFNAVAEKNSPVGRKLVELLMDGGRHGAYLTLSHGKFESEPGLVWISDYAPAGLPSRD